MMVENVSLTPELIRIPVPCWGRAKDKNTVQVSNDGDKKIVFKVKVTHVNRFQVHPGFGFLEAGCKANILLKPRPFEDMEKYNEHMTILVAVVPPDLPESKTPKSIWKEPNLILPTSCKRLVVKIEYFDKCKKKKSKAKDSNDDDDSSDSDDMTDDEPISALRNDQSQNQPSNNDEDQKVTFE